MLASVTLADATNPDPGKGRTTASFSFITFFSGQYSPQPRFRFSDIYTANFVLGSCVFLVCSPFPSTFVPPRPPSASPEPATLYSEVGLDESSFDRRERGTGTGANSGAAGVRSCRIRLRLEETQIESSNRKILAKQRNA